MNKRLAVKVRDATDRRIKPGQRRIWVNRYVAYEGSLLGGWGKAHESRRAAVEVGCCDPACLETAVEFMEVIK